MSPKYTTILIATILTNVISSQSFLPSSSCRPIFSITSLSLRPILTQHSLPYNMRSEKRLALDHTSIGSTFQAPILSSSQHHVSSLKAQKLWTGANTGRHTSNSISLSLFSLYRLVENHRRQKRGWHIARLTWLTSGCSVWCVTTVVVFHRTLAQYP